MTSASRIVYKPRESASPEDKLAALALVYAFVIDRTEEKKGGCGAAPNDAMKGSKDDRAKPILPQ